MLGRLVPEEHSPDGRLRVLRVGSTRAEIAEDVELGLDRWFVVCRVSPLASSAPLTRVLAGNAFAGRRARLHFLVALAVLLQARRFLAGAPLFGQFAARL